MGVNGLCVASLPRMQTGAADRCCKTDAAEKGGRSTLKDDVDVGEGCGATGGGTARRPRARRTRAGAQGLAEQTPRR